MEKFNESLPTRSNGRLDRMGLSKRRRYRWRNRCNSAKVTRDNDTFDGFDWAIHRSNKRDVMSTVFGADMCGRVVEEALIEKQGSLAAGLG